MGARDVACYNGVCSYDYVIRYGYRPHNDRSCSNSYPVADDWNPSVRSYCHVVINPKVGANFASKNICILAVLDPKPWSNLRAINMKFSGTSVSVSFMIK